MSLWSRQPTPVKVILALVAVFAVVMLLRALPMPSVTDRSQTGGRAL